VSSDNDLTTEGVGGDIARTEAKLRERNDRGRFAYAELEL
jgi:hypothetical protein